MLKKLLMLPYTFALLNWAPVAGLFLLLRGRQAGFWNPAIHRG
jgi:hypothetical protein